MLNPTNDDVAGDTDVKAPLTPEQYLAVKAAQETIIDKAKMTIGSARRRADAAETPPHTREALYSDRVRGAVLWLRPELRKPGHRAWRVVGEIQYTTLPISDFTGDDGKGYQLCDFLVEIKP